MRVLMLEGCGKDRTPGSQWPRINEGNRCCVDARSSMEDNGEKIMDV